MSWAESEGILAAALAKMRAAAAAQAPAPASALAPAPTAHKQVPGRATAPEKQYMQGR